MSSGGGPGSRRVVAALFLLACIAAATTIVVARNVFPNGTADLDEVAYVSQANAVAHHGLTLPAATHDPYFRPFLSGVHSERVVFKYQPAWPALIALSDGVFGSSLPLRVSLAIAGLLACAWFAWELTRDARIAVITALLVVASPFTWMQTASLLGYQLSFVLGAAAAAALVRTARVPSVGNGLAAGALVGLAVFHRPFDAVIATAPVFVYWLWRVGHGEERGRRVLAVLLGGLPFAALFFAYNRSVMGSVTHLAYGMSGPSDRFGFGWRASFTAPDASHVFQIHYTFARAVSTLGHLFVVLPKFVAFAPVVAVLAAVCVWSRRRDPRAWLLVAMIAIVVVGYFFWWGVANAYQFNLDRSLGPFYYYPVLAPLCVLAAWGAVQVHYSRASVLVAAGVAVLWLGTAAAVVRDARSAGEARTNEVRMLTAPVSPSLLFEAPQFVGDPYLRVATDATLRDADLVAVDVPGGRFVALDRFPNRALFVQRAQRNLNDLFGDVHRDRVALRVVRGEKVVVRAHVVLAANQTGTVYVQIGDRTPEMVTMNRGEFDASTVLSAARLAHGGSNPTLVVGVVVARVGEPTRERFTGERLACVTEARAVTHGQIEVLDPCDGRHRYVFPNGASTTTAEDVSSRFTVSFAAD